MAKIRIDHATSLSRDDIRKRLGEVMGEVERRFDLEGAWQGDSYAFKRSGLDGTAVVEDGRVSVTMELGLILGVLKGRIESELRAKLAEKLP